jgi:hypothetical protein
MNSHRRNQDQKDMSSYLARSIKNLNGRLKFSDGELPIFHEPLDPVDERRS